VDRADDVMIEMAVARPEKRVQTCISTFWRFVDLTVLSLSKSKMQSVPVHQYYCTSLSTQTRRVCAQY